MAHLAALDKAQFGNGFVVIAGWLAVPRSEPWPDMVWLRVGVHEFLLESWFVRQDLPDSPEGPLFLAFRDDFSFPTNAHHHHDVTIHVGNGGAPLATLVNEAWEPFSPLGHLDVVSQVGISGWVYHPGLWHGALVATLTFDGRMVSYLPFNRARSDLSSSAGLRGQHLGFVFSSEKLGELLSSFEPFRDGEPHSWSVTIENVEVAKKVVALPPMSLGRLEAYEGQSIRGWAAFKEHPRNIGSVEILIEGIHYAHVRAVRPRRDLQEKGLSTYGGGFALPLATSPHRGQKIDIKARMAGESRWLVGSPLVLQGLPVPLGVGAAPWRWLAEKRPRITIIIPVYNAADDLALCLESIIAHTGRDARVIIIDDASSDPRVAAILRPYYGKTGITILTNTENLGFTRTCNRGINVADRDDVILLNSDTIVPERWIENLVVAAYSSSKVASATPLSNNAGAFSAPQIGVENRFPGNLTSSDLSRLVAQASFMIYPQVPTGHGYCMYVRRDAIDELGMLDAAAFPRGYGEENDFLMRALRAGRKNVIDDRTYVLHRQSASFGTTKAPLLAAGRGVVDERYPEYKNLVRMFHDDERLLNMRWRIRKAFNIAAPPRPRILFVISTETGGTPQTNLDLMRALEDRYEPWLMRCSGRVITLHRLIDRELQQVSSLQLGTPLVMSVHQSEDYTDAVAAILLENAIEILHIRHLAWHGLDLPKIAKRLGIPVVLSLHDFYIVCPTIKLLDGEMKHCAGHCTVGEGVCRAELWPQEQVPPLRNRFVYRWRTMMEEALVFCDAIVTTSGQARQLIVDVFPKLAHESFAIVEHGRDFPAFRRPRYEQLLDRPLRILVPGNISQAKGADLIREMVRLDNGRRVEFIFWAITGLLERRQDLFYTAGTRGKRSSSALRRFPLILGRSSRFGLKLIAIRSRSFGRVVCQCLPKTLARLASEFAATGAGGLQAHGTPRFYSTS